MTTKEQTLIGVVIRHTHDGRRHANGLWVEVAIVVVIYNGILQPNRLTRSFTFHFFTILLVWPIGVHHTARNTLSKYRNQ